MERNTGLTQYCFEKTVQVLLKRSPRHLTSRKALSRSIFSRRPAVQSLFSLSQPFLIPSSSLFSRKLKALPRKVRFFLHKELRLPFWPDSFRHARTPLVPSFLPPAQRIRACGRERAYTSRSSLPDFFFRRFTNLCFFFASTLFFSGSLDHSPH